MIDLDALPQQALGGWDQLLRHSYAPPVRAPVRVVAREPEAKGPTKAELQADAQAKRDAIVAWMRAHDHKMRATMTCAEDVARGIELYGKGATSAVTEHLKMLLKLGIVAKTERASHDFHGKRRNGWWLK